MLKANLLERFYFLQTKGIVICFFEHEGKSVQILSNLRKKDIVDRTEEKLFEKSKNQDNCKRN
ncbi:hypothetical protein CMI44_00775 [Candidatus Pacearchaeota archaeon]|nr:hypothetical protein [Candidatus Pacearchaeota archaeon]|tara:strand:- start:345 stop:533 length:189 start_codon:yes stop_codon:yes gene_type:complete